MYRWVEFHKGVEENKEQDKYVRTVERTLQDIYDRVYGFLAGLCFSFLMLSFADYYSVAGRPAVASSDDNLHCVETVEFVISCSRFHILLCLQRSVTQDKL